MRRIIWIPPLSLALAVGLTGCASSSGPAMLTIDSARYEKVFDTALEMMRREGMNPVVIDRRGGIIETEPRIAGSILEPWDRNNASYQQAMDNTLSFQRRRARFEFLPGRRSPVRFPTQRPIRPREAAGLTAQPVDLTSYEGDIDVLVTVTVERQYRPGQRRNTWSRRLTTQSAFVGPDENLPPNFWTPVIRDTAFERRLLARIEELEKQSREDEEETADERGDLREPQMHTDTH